MAKSIIYNEQARRALKEGVDTISDAVKVTLGPKGRNIAIAKSFGSQVVTKDGVTVAKEIEEKDPFKNVGVEDYNDKVFFKLKNDLGSLLFSTYYGGTADDYDPVGERGIKFNDCRIYTIVTAQSNNIPLTQGALNTTKSSPNTRYEPGLVVWANPNLQSQ